MPLYNIKYSVIEKGDKTRDANDSERLSTYSAKDHACESGGNESFVNAVEATCAAVHIVREGDLVRISTSIRITCWGDAGRRTLRNRFGWCQQMFYTSMHL